MGRPRKHSSVSREDIGTSMVVHVKGEGWGGSDRDGHHNRQRGFKSIYNYFSSACNATSMYTHRGPQDH